MVVAAPVSEGDILAGKYRVERVLGEGGMGVVVAAQHVQLGQRVALKFLLREAYDVPEAVERFLREGRAAVQIRSEHIARVSDVGTLENGAPYMVMEYLEGSDLSAVLRSRGSLTVAEAADYLLQACEAIAEAHSLGIVHRDLKPANLFLTRRADGSTLVKVLDFGISKIGVGGGPGAASVTSTTAVIGSPLYMSPEQVRSSKNVDARSDVWSLGVILHELVTGRTAYQADTLAGVLAAVVADPPAPLRAHWPEAPVELESLVLHCLEKDLTRRYQSVADFARALLPFAPPASRVSFERITRLVSSSGLNLDKTAAEGLPNVDRRAISGPSHSRTPASHTVSGWGRTGPSPRGGPPIVAIALGVVVVVGVLTGGAWFVLRKPVAGGPVAASSGPTAAPPAARDPLPPAVPTVAEPPAVPAFHDPPSAAGASSLPTSEPSTGQAAPSLDAHSAIGTGTAAANAQRNVTSPSAKWAGGSAGPSRTKPQTPGATTRPAGAAASTDNPGGNGAFDDRK